MHPGDLNKIWNAPDRSKLTRKQISLRLPILVAAKISALCELYPRENKTHIIGDLLATALDQLEEGMPSVKGPKIDGDSMCSFYAEIGIKNEFYNLTIKYLRELEKEIGVKEPLDLPPPEIFEQH